ncbi:MAG: class I SAM-dependent methyltransferase [Sphaerospermopsis sp. SIO1G1]|nr:class I SAM-dependent methyltransferase [Sphaerospermopsis sp. SIO1G1]
MTTSINTTPKFTSSLINSILSFKPLFNIAKHQARQMMIKRAKKIGINWYEEVEKLQVRDWTDDLAQIQNPQLTYPEYYTTSFHAYESGNLSWQAAFEVESAAYAVHAKVWQNFHPEGDAKLRASYHNILKNSIFQPPQDILDLGCSVGMSSFALQELYPEAKITGLDLSPYFLAVANYRSQQRQTNINWVHAQAESTGLADNSFDLVSIFLMCHELPQSATKNIFAEARRVLRPSGHLTFMDMNPQSEIYKKMPAYVFTLLKSTEPYLDEYFTLDIEQALIESGFQSPTITSNSPRHRTVIAQVQG